MAKITLEDITAGFGATTLINANNTAIEAAIENTLSRDGTSPNYMNTTLDMNGNRIINQANPISVEGFNWEGPWVTATSYEVGDVVEDSNSSYICIVEHTSGTFATDLAALKWQVVASSAALPSQSGHAGAVLTTDGGSASWLDPSPTIQSLLLDATEAEARSTLGAVGLTGNENIAGEKTFTDNVVSNGGGFFSVGKNVVAHATSSDIWIANYVVFTGSSTTFTDFADAPYIGAETEALCGATHTFTNNANMVVEGGTQTVAVGDRIRVRALAVNVFRITVIKNLPSSIGTPGYSWQDMSASRTTSVGYTNSTGRPIMLCVKGVLNAAGANIAVSCNGPNIAYSNVVASAGDVASVNGIIVPTNGTYAVAGSGGSLTSILWMELR